MRRGYAGYGGGGGYHPGGVGGGAGPVGGGYGGGRGYTGGYAGPVGIPGAPMARAGPTMGLAGRTVGSRDSGRHSSTSPGSGSPLSDSRRSRSGTGSPRDLSPPILHELANMNLRELAKRPDLGGTLGRPIPVLANYFQINLHRSDLIVSQYHVDINHPSPNRKLDREENRLIFWTVVAAHKDLFTNPFALAYDGAHLLFTPAKIRFPEDRCSIQLEAEVPLARDAREKTKCAVAFQLVGPILMDVSKARSGVVDERVMTPIQIMDIVFRQGLSCPLMGHSERFYPWKSSVFRIPGAPGEAVELGAGVEMWTGFYSSAHISALNAPILNVDISHSVFYKPRLWMPAFMCEVLKEKLGGGCGGNGYQGQRGQRPMGPGPNGANGLPAYDVRALNPGSLLSQAEWKALAEAVKGLRVRIEHQRGSVRVYRINALSEPADQLSFTAETEEGERRLTVAEYFGERYGPLQFPRLPCLHVGHPQRHIYFPLEVATLEWPRKFGKKMTEKMTSSVIRAAAVDAESRCRRIQALAAEAGWSHRDPFLDSFGLSMDMRMLELRARVLPAPRILFKAASETEGARRTEPWAMPKDGSWGTDGQVLLEPATCTSYALIGLVPQREQMALQNFCDALWRKATQLGMQFPHWPDIVKFARNREDLSYLFEEILAEYKRNQRQCQLILIVMPARNSDTYTVAKECSDLVHGVMSQCLLMKTVQKPSPSTCSNILLKLNTKLGGVNSRIAPDPISSRYLVEQPTLVMGIDVTHPTLQEERTGMPSVAAIVSNLDLLPAVFGANVKVQKKCRESVVYLLDAVRERLVQFYKATSQKPSRIIVYRDGVSEGQFMEVLREEMQGIRTACLMLSPDYRPPITYIVVQKRHHARLFCANPGADAVGRARNIPPGTTLDTGIVSPHGFDFLLCSHFGIQGTSRPSRYHVLWDENNLNSDEVESLTYSLCHIYARCPRAVSIPAPVYYAHLVATRARYHVKHRLGLRDSEAATNASALCPAGVVGRGPRAVESGLGASPAAGGSHSDSLSDSALQDAVLVAHPFKSRMYYI